jgi:glycogen operon protein
LTDLVSYSEKHNEPNEDENRDGDNNNQSWNCGVEGPTDDPQINALRDRQQRNFLTTLFLSQGVPMICGGDEWGRTQNGNNNAYCQDNEISWFNWKRNDKQNQLFEFTRRLIQLRKAHAVFRRPKFLKGRRIPGSNIRDVMWFNPGGNQMIEEEWTSPFVRCLGMLLSGDATDVLNFEGQAIRDETFLLLINAHYEPVPFVLPGQERIEWQLMLDTTNPSGFLADPKKFSSGDEVGLGGRACCLLQLISGTQAQAREESWKKRHVDFPPVSAEQERAGL